MSYQLWGLIGIALAWLVRRLLCDAQTLPNQHRWLIIAAALLGSVLGAYLLELPADVWGWTWHGDHAGATEADAPLFGRTVLGGLIGGWGAVELAKYGLGLPHGFSTGDAFAAPLAAALMCGRLGCWSAGCCAGATCPEGAWWSAVACDDAYGVARFPAQLCEVAVHALALLWLLAADRMGWQRGRRFAWYMGGYAVLRFALESWRANPGLPWAGGMTWYQVLALILGAMSVATLVAQRRLIMQRTAGDQRKSG